MLRRVIPNALHSRLRPAPALGRAARGVVVLLAALVAPLQAQVSASAELSGTALDETGEPIRGAVVTLWSLGRWTGAEVFTDRNGRFGFTELRPGEYDVRVEVVGFFPRVVTGFTTRPGARSALVVRLRAGAPPIDRVDTVSAAAGAVDPERWFGAMETEALSDTRLLQEQLLLHSQVDGDGGANGLSNRFTTYTVQGVPFRAASEGYGRQAGQVALSAGSLGLLRANLLGPSSGAGLGAGGEVEAFNPNLAAGATEIAVSASGDPLWTPRYETPEDRSPLSAWGRVRTSFDLLPDSLRLVVGGDFHRVERPRLPLFLTAAPEAVNAPALEVSQALSAYALLDWEMRSGGRADLGVRIGSAPAAQEALSLAVPRGMSPREARDLVVGAGLRTPLGARGSLTVRGGATRSERSSADDWPVDATAPLVMQAGSGRLAGVDPRFAEEAQRSGTFGSLRLALKAGDHGLEFGLSALRSNHTLDPLAGSRIWGGDGDVFDADWVGYASRYGNTLGAREFGTTRFTVFLDDTWNAAPGVRVRAGWRWTREGLPDDVDNDTAWQTASGVELPAAATSAGGMSGHVAVDWTPTQARGLALQGAVGVTLDETDPWLLAEALSLDGSARRERVLLQAPGSDAWPAFPSGAFTLDAPSLTLLPDSWSLPTTVYGTAGLVTEVQGWKVGVTGTLRRTENLTRRTDLNRAPTPSGATENGRSVWGALEAAGGVVAPRPGSSRRFTSFDRVWFLVQDGWSEYRAATFLLERRMPGGLEVGAWYTLSSTTDNLPGLGSARPELSAEAPVPVEDWSEGTSDFDVPHRVAAVVALPFGLLQGGVIRSRVRVESGLPFTPGLRDGVDLNGDGIFGNDPVFIPTDGIQDVRERFACVNESRGDFMERNACRHPLRKTLDLGLDLGLVRLGRGVLSLQVDGLDLLQAWRGRWDEALFRANAGAGLSADGTALAPTLDVNPWLGSQLVSLDQGRTIRIGLRWGGGR